MTDNLQQLGPTGFQDLAGALAIAAFGPGVQAMGRGRDGGRDLYHRGPLSWQSVPGFNGEVWDGYTVIQVKHKSAISARPDDNASWLWGEIRKELSDWSKAADRSEVPDFLVVVTNVPLTPTPDTGGHDRVINNIRNYIAKLDDDSRDIDKSSRNARLAQRDRLRRIQKFRIWDEFQLTTLLKVHDQVRKAFPGMLTAADVFAALSDMTGSIAIGDLETALRVHARTTLTGDGFVYFDEAGGSDGSGYPIHEVAIDLPSVNSQGDVSTVVQYALERAEHMLKPTFSLAPKPRHLIITGAPGNGKTTVSRFLVQAFRAAMLEGATELSDEQRITIFGYQQALSRMGCELPRNRRWPIRIDLAEYAEDGGLSQESTLLRWISQKVSQRLNDGTVHPWALHQWMAQWPWLLVFDGLDEVTEPDTRKRLIRRVVELVNEAEAENCDLLAILTTRPIGYTENISPTQFERIDLHDLTVADALQYGEKATRVRLRSDQDRIERVMTRLREVAQDESLRNLLRTPLQVLIMTIILDGTGTLSPDRYSLFWGYYDTVFRRERDKKASLRRLLQDYGQQILRLHEHVGFELQVRSESGDRSYATLSASELQDVIWRVLDRDGFQPSGRDSGLRDQIFTAVTQRLVLLTPRRTTEGYGFDVRSLQELMAARELASGPLVQVKERLHIAGASPHWRNSWIFAAGQLFADPQDHHHEAVVEVLESFDINASQRLGMTLPTGPRLALELIDDGMARSLPRWRNRIISHGLRLLWEPISDDFSFYARILMRYAAVGDEQRETITEALRAALGGSDNSRQTAHHFQGLVPDLVSELGLPARMRGLGLARTRSVDNSRLSSSDGWEDFDLEIATSRATDAQRAGLRDVAAAIRRLARVDQPAAHDVGLVTEVLLNGSGPTLDDALLHIMAHEPRLLKSLREDALPIVLRQPIGDLLRLVADSQES
ncbi:NACHT domain-containing protein [Pseudonocardia sp.]|uniref:NACHT domain-containing protein n=1 Tax=Pseudonocardia sp. TaxID=60912 RepID=UPI003D0ED705